MKHIFYGIGTILSILSGVIFLSRPRDHRLDVSFSAFWVLVVLCLIFDCRNEMVRREKIQRNLTSGRRRGSFNV